MSSNSIVLTCWSPCGPQPLPKQLPHFLCSRSAHFQNTGLQLLSPWHAALVLKICSPAAQTGGFALAFQVHLASAQLLSSLKSLHGVVSTAHTDLTRSVHLYRGCTQEQERERQHEQQHE